MLVLFILHNILNKHWYRGLFKGRYHPVRVFQLCVIGLVLVAMAIQMYSGIRMSREVFDFLPLDGNLSTIRLLHILGAYWGFVLMCLHLGMHGGMMSKVVKKRPLSESSEGQVASVGAEARISGKAPFFAGLLIASYGIFVFFKRDFPTYMFLQSEFVFMDYSEPPALFYLDYLALVLLWAFAGHYSTKLLKIKLPENRKRR
ncbi:MAG: DUF4405 domain-containing protein [Bacillota bacterium]|nr:DUF4405 domain-containing protein [Bacillota bacterium]